jgi:hypothetical protein
MMKQKTHGPKFTVASAIFLKVAKFFERYIRYEVIFNAIQSYFNWWGFDLIFLVAP